MECVQDPDICSFDPDFSKSVFQSIIVVEERVHEKLNRSFSERFKHCRQRQEIIETDFDVERSTLQRVVSCQLLGDLSTSDASDRNLDDCSL